MTIDPIAPGLFVEHSDGPHLLAGRSKDDRRLVFPLPQGAAGEGFEAVPLSRTGRLWSFTVQRFRPKSPPYAGADDEKTFRPYAVGYIELAGEIIVEGRLETENFGALKVGQTMELVLQDFARENGVVTSYAFRPVAG
jgi:uncharacterized OB-fold protein